MALIEVAPRRLNRCSAPYYQLAMWCVKWRWWWLDKNGTLNLPCAVFSVPTRSPRQKALIAKAHDAVLYPRQWQMSHAKTRATSQMPPIHKRLCHIVAFRLSVEHFHRRKESMSACIVGLSHPRAICAGNPHPQPMPR